ncbi:MAG: tyrosine--tRNA ligase [Candidatus Acidiferrales bacterium]
MTISFKPVDEQLAYLRKGVAEIIPEDEFRKKLEKSAQSGKPLRVKLGVDPTAPDLHLGHTVVLRKLKHFQDMGHTAIFLIGDFTAMVGDPTGQSETRPPLSREQIEANTKTYLAQVYRILDRERTEIRYNSEWLDKLTSHEIVMLCTKFTLPRIEEREDFRSRLSAARQAAVYEEFLRLPIGAGAEFDTAKSFKPPAPGQSAKKPSTVFIHELLYPLFQAYDSVILKADVELGATEQKFNLLVGREIQREYGQAPQVAMTMPILVGLDGKRKMSKSLNNYVGITEPPDRMYGKMMSVSDELMWSYYELLTDINPVQLTLLKESVRTGKLHPMQAKMDLARTIVTDFHGAPQATHAQAQFERKFRDRDVAASAAKVLVGSEAYRDANEPAKARTKLARLVAQLGKVSRAEAERLMRQGAVEVDGERISDPAADIDLSDEREFLLKVGKFTALRVSVSGLKPLEDSAAAES